MARESGVVADGRQVDEHAHTYWLFTERSEFVDRALDFQADGRERHLRVAYVADRPAAELEGERAPLGDVSELVASGRLLIASLPDTYPSRRVIDPDDQVEVATSIGSTA